MLAQATSHSAVVRKFEAARLWQSNVYGAAVAGIGATILISLVAGILVFGTRMADVFLTAAMMIAGVTLGIVCMYPGNLIAVHPYAVELDPGRGLRLFAPLKNIFIPLEQVKGVQRSYLQLGWVVKLGRRHGALTRFYIHGGFGSQGKELARAIEDEIARRDSPNLSNPR